MIKKFAFRLERVLRYRANIEVMRERELAEVEACLLRERRILGKLMDMRVELLGELARLQATPFSGLDRDLYQQYLDWLGEEVKREERTIVELVDLSGKKRAELIKASQDRRIVERLKEKRLSEHGAAVARVDQQSLDEIATNDFAREVLHVPSAPLRKKL